MKLHESALSVPLCDFPYFFVFLAIQRGIIAAEDYILFPVVPVIFDTSQKWFRTPRKWYSIWKATGTMSKMSGIVYRAIIHNVSLKSCTQIL